VQAQAQVDDARQLGLSGLLSGPGGSSGAG